ncbi:MAG: hypothetical protein QOH49_5121 [Acidobacteriota bacterium]|jgi:hypothetical protein|nr:hypothetical protein [Acidobacteriota bacterium]
MSKRVSLLALALCSVVSPVRVGAQEPQAAKPKPAKASAKKPGAEPADPLAEMKRTTAISLVSTLADDARMFRDPSLRARVQARAADALWETEREKSVALFRRAWDEAESADAESDRRIADERARQQRERGSSSIQLPPSLRTEVLRLAAKRDRALGEEFLTKLDEARKREHESAATSNERPTDTGRGGPPEQERPDPMETPPAVAKRLRLASQLLQDGDVERATQFADPALGAVTALGLEFLTRLRAKNAQAADERYAMMMMRAEVNPASDANTASLLSSYLFSPMLYMTFSANAGSNANSWGRDAFAPPVDVSPKLRAAYLRTAASILLRPTPTPDQDHTSSGRAGWYMVITRLLPLFDQYAPDRSAALRGKQASLTPDTPDGIRASGNNALTRGLVPEDPNRDRVSETLGRLDRAKTADDRDAVYVDAVFDAMRQKDSRVEEFLGKIEDTDTRKQLRAYIDMEAAREAVNDKQVTEVLRLARGNTLTSIQRAWALTEAARLLSKDEPGRAVEVLDEALTEAKERIDPASRERVSALVAIATQLYELDRARTWEVMLDVVKASNAAKEYTGEDGRIGTRFQTKNMTMMSSNSAQSFDLTDIFMKLAREELQRAADLARSFEGESPRSFATLAVARSVLDNKAEKKQERAAN